jgi:hypothetical protein
MSFDDYKRVIYRNRPGEAVTELAKVFRLIEEAHRESGVDLPSDSTEILHAWRPRRRVPVTGFEM